MAEGGNEEKTEKASEKKLEDSRKKGQVAKSQELASATSLLVGLLTVLAMMPWSARRVSELFTAVMRTMEWPSLYSVESILLESLKLASLLSFAPALAAAFAAVACLWLQVGPVFALDVLTPKLARMNPAAGLKKLFGMKNLISLGLMLLKTATVGFAVVLVCRHVLPDAIRVVQGDMSAALAVARLAVVKLLLWCGTAFLALGAVDYGYQKWQYAKDVRMGRSELKRERRESDGDPHLKNERKRMGSEPSTADLLKYMHLAVVVLQDDDGRIVGIAAHRNLGPRPIFLLRATGSVAVQGIAIARSKSVKVLKDSDLVGELFPQAHSGNPVPQKYLMPIYRAMLVAAKR